MTLVLSYSTIISMSNIETKLSAHPFRIAFAVATGIAVGTMGAEAIKSSTVPQEKPVQPKNQEVVTDPSKFPTFSLGEDQYFKKFGLQITPQPITTPTLERSRAVSHAWAGNNITVTTECPLGSPTFGIKMSGNVVTGSEDGVWTTLRGDDRAIVVSYDQGNGQSPIHIAYNFDDQVNSIRGEQPINLNTSISTTFGYEIKAYGAPQTHGTPNLSNQIGSVKFATDCR